MKHTLTQTEMKRCGYTHICAGTFTLTHAYERCIHKDTDAHSAVRAVWNASRLPGNVLVCCEFHCGMVCCPQATHSELSNASAFQCIFKQVCLPALLRLIAPQSAFLSLSQGLKKSKTKFLIFGLKTQSPKSFSKRYRDRNRHFIMTNITAGCSVNSIMCIFLSTTWDHKKDSGHVRKSSSNYHKTQTASEYHTMNSIKKKCLHLKVFPRT